MSKGVSPLLGAPLLILITVTVAVLVSGWLTDLSKEQAGEIQNTTQEKLACEYAGILIRSIAYDCNSSCAAGNPHTLTAYVDNTGSTRVSIDKIYVENNKGSLYTLELNETNIISAGDSTYLINISSTNCSSINNSIDNVVIITNNCPNTAHDKFPGEDVSYVNC